MLAEAESVCAVADASACFHCGESALPAASLHFRIDGRERTFCCPGCLAIAQTIDAAGLAPYYAQRTSPAAPADSDSDAERRAAQAVAAGAVAAVAPGQHEAALLLEGLRCGACVWLIETWLARKPYIVEASVNFATRRARVRWRGEAHGLAFVLRDIAMIGYRGYAYDPARREALLRRETRTLLVRMGVALLASMQVMMLAVPGLPGRRHGRRVPKGVAGLGELRHDAAGRRLLRRPLLRGRLRGACGARVPGMDVPVALGVAGAFAASAWSTFTGHGEVYYDSVTMFVALLLVARYCEHRARAKAARAIESVAARAARHRGSRARIRGRDRGRARARHR